MAALLYGIIFSGLKRFSFGIPLLILVMISMTILPMPPFLLDFCFFQYHPFIGNPNVLCIYHATTYFSLFPTINFDYDIITIGH